jgi:putative effector of murein hydrolase
VPKDIDTALQWLKVISVITAICVTAFPLLYLFSPWYRSQLGRAVMLQSISVAFAIDISVVYQYWRFTTDLQTLFFINIGLLTFIAGTSIFLTTMLVIYNLTPNKEEIDVDTGSEQQDV